MHFCQKFKIVPQFYFVLLILIYSNKHTRGYFYAHLYLWTTHGIFLPIVAIIFEKSCANIKDTSLMRHFLTTFNSISSNDSATKFTAALWKFAPKMREWSSPKGSLFLFRSYGQLQRAREGEREREEQSDSPIDWKLIYRLSRGETLHSPALLRRKEIHT